jgi:hypothetical protein
MDTAAGVGCTQIPGKDCMGVGYLVAESLRTGASLEGLPLTLRRVERFEVGEAATGQPPVWSGIEFEFPESEVERVAAALAAVIEAHRWWADLRADGETFIVFAERVFRFPTGDTAASAEARDYGLAVGVPAGQLDWS